MKVSMYSTQFPAYTSREAAVQHDVEGLLGAERLKKRNGEFLGDTVGTDEQG